MGLKIKIKGNKDLYERWRKFNPGLAAIVQNNHELSDEQLKEWTDKYMVQVKKLHQDHMQKVAELSKLMQDTAFYIEQCRKSNG